MDTLPRNARFVGLDGREHIVFTPASEHAHGWVEVDNGFFACGQAERDVEVTYLPEVTR